MGADQTLAGLPTPPDGSYLGTRPRRAQVAQPGPQKGGRTPPARVVPMERRSSARLGAARSVADATAAASGGGSSSSKPPPPHRHHGLDTGLLPED